MFGGGRLGLVKKRTKLIGQTNEVRASRMSLFANTNEHSVIFAGRFRRRTVRFHATLAQDPAIWQFLQLVESNAFCYFTPTHVTRDALDTAHRQNAANAATVNPRPR